MPDAPDEAALRAAVLARLERRGFTPERGRGDDAAPAPEPGILDPLATAVCAPIAAWLVWDRPPGLDAVPTAISQVFAVLFVLAGIWAGLSFVSAVWGMCRAAGGEGRDA